MQSQLVQDVIQNKNGIIKHVNVSIKIIVNAKNIIVGITCICENIKYLKYISDPLVNECDEFIIVIDILSSKKANTIATNVTGTASIICHSKKVRDCYILDTVLIVIILLLIITIICYYAKQEGIT